MAGPDAPHTPVRRRARAVAALTVAALAGLVVLAVVQPDATTEAASTRTETDDPTPAALPTETAPPAPGDPFDDDPTGLPQPRVSLTVPTIPAGVETQLSGRFAGTEVTGEIAALERRTDGKDPWDTVASTTVDTEGRFSFLVTEDDPGTYPYRVLLAGTSKHKPFMHALTLTATEADPATSTASTSSAEAIVRVAPPERCNGDVPLRDDGTPWICTYDDEFDGSSLDRRYWLAQVSADTNFYTGTATEPACFVDDRRVLDIRDGHLVLGAEVLDRPVDCGAKSSDRISGMVSHHGTFAQTYGRYEVRARVPSYAGKGLQETFWLWPVDMFAYGIKHPASGEIDFAEIYSSYHDLVIPVVHYLFDPYSINFTSNTNIYTAYTCSIRVGQFNTYTLDWYPGLIRIRVNGQVCLTNAYRAWNATEQNPYAPFDKPFFLALTQLFGADGNEFDPAVAPKESQTEIDYVRIWR